MANLTFMSIADASAYTGLSKYYIREACKKKTIPFIMSGSKYLINIPLFLSQLNNDSLHKSNKQLMQEEE